MKRVLVTSILVLVALFALAPLLIVALTSLKNEQEMFANVLGLPTVLRLSNYATVWVQRGFSGFFVNSILITLPVVAVVLLCSALAGFAISKMRFHGRQFIFYLILLGLMIPLPSLIIPLYKDLSLMRLLDTRLGAILPEAAIALPFGVFLMRTFFNNVNDELLEAARMEGAGELQVLTRIVAPLAGPGLKSLGLIEFMWAWQSYLLPLVIIRTEAIKPLTVSLDLFVGRFSTSYTLIATAAVIVFIPITIVYVITQKTFIQGLTMGSIK
jgi:raffinose/stachyose/melibiose transport system permease protein